MSEPLHEVLYCSVIAPDESPTIVSTILARARDANAANGITGLLVFDGMHFVQHLEGPGPQVEQLMRRIEADQRHTGVRVIYRGGLAARRYRSLEMGFAEPPETDDGSALDQLEGEAGLLQFLALRPQFDIQS